MKKYYPILLSKAGEFKALSKLSAKVATEITPVIEILPNNLGRTEEFLLNHWQFDENEVILDFSNYNTHDAAIIAEIESFFTTLFTRNINALPAIQPNSSPLYISLIKKLAIRYDCHVCIRVSNSGGGLNNLDLSATTLLSAVNRDRRTAILLVDLGYAENNNYNLLAALAINSLMGLPNKNAWLDIVVASGSFPENLTNFKALLTPHRIDRLEWKIWNAVISSGNLVKYLHYGDYGNKNPIYGGEVNYSGTCSIKYTVKDEFVIYRGELSQNHKDGNGQYVTFAKKLIASADYYGRTFSWGDDGIWIKAQQIVGAPNLKPGSSTTWVELTQNHHITLLHSLL